MNLGPVMEGWQHLRLVSDAQYISLGKTMWRLSYRSVPCTASSFQPKVSLESVSSPLGLIDKPAGSLGLCRLSAASGSSSRASRSQVPMSQGQSPRYLDGKGEHTTNPEVGNRGPELLEGVWATKNTARAKWSRSIIIKTVWESFGIDLMAQTGTVGIQMKLEFFQRKFWTASRQCASLDGKCSISCDDETVNCYLIDNNGFILVSEDYTQANSSSSTTSSIDTGIFTHQKCKCPSCSQQQHIPTEFAKCSSVPGVKKAMLDLQSTGDFFGEVEGAVMNKLLTMGSFKRITLYDYQAMCRANKESSDGAHGLLDPYNAFLAAIKWIMTELVLFQFYEFKADFLLFGEQTLSFLLLQCNLCNKVITSSGEELALGSLQIPSTYLRAQKLKQTLEPCDTEYPAFVSERTIKETSGNIACEDCSNILVYTSKPGNCVGALGKPRMNKIMKLMPKGLEIDRLAGYYSSLFIRIMLPSISLWDLHTSDLHSPPFRIAHDFDKKNPWQHKVEKGTHLSTVFMPRKMSPKTLSKHSSPRHLCAFGRKMGGEGGYKMRLRITHDPQDGIFVKCLVGTYWTGPTALALFQLWIGSLTPIDLLEECQQDVKSFVIQQIPSSNLFMVVVDSSCLCESVAPITMAPIEIRVRKRSILEICLNNSQHNESLKCERLKAQKIRRRPESCHGFHPEIHHENLTVVKEL
eukprot:bmy_10121T0